MLVCTRPLIANYDGVEVRLLPGRSRVIEGHPLAVAFPRHFAAGPCAGTRERIAASVPELDTVTRVRPAMALERPTIQELRARRPIERPSGGRLPYSRVTRLSAVASHYRVRVATSALTDVRADLRSTTELDGLESGAAMYGPRPASWRDTIEITRVGTLGPKAERSPRSLGRDHEHDVLEGQRIRKQSDGNVREIGLWHCHANGDATPSSADLAHWSGMRALLGLALYIGVIALPGERGWAEPELVAYVVRPDGDEDVCERAHLD